ncbi:MAG: GNAT family N-acetyltransferase [Sphingosinicella sp.]
MANEIALFDDLDAVGADAGGALGRSAQPRLFDRLSWFYLCRKFTPQGKPLVIRVRNGIARCWLFLEVRGGKALAMSNWFCLRYGPVVDQPAGGNAPLEDFATGLRRAGVFYLYASPIEESDGLAAALRRRWWLTRLSPDTVNWRISTRGLSFEQYWMARPSRLRNTAERRARKSRLRPVIHDRFDAKAWDDYEEVYRGSWKPSEGAPELLRRLAELESAAGTVRLGIAYHQERAVAAQFWTVENGIATIHKLAYREDARELSPGTILCREMFRHVLDVDRVEMIDFGVGDHDYKRDWMSHSVPLYALTAYDLLRPAGLFGIVQSLALKAFELVKWRRAVSAE